jgi:hypothetical protein
LQPFVGPQQCRDSDDVRRLNRLILFTKINSDFVPLVDTRIRLSTCVPRIAMVKQVLISMKRLGELKAKQSQMQKLLEYLSYKLMQGAAKMINS